MIKIIGDAKGSGSIVESDPWIPLKVTWTPRPSGQPIYLRVSGNRGGEVEVKVDPASGVLVQVIVIDAPPRTGRIKVAKLRDEPGCRVPIIDRSILNRDDKDGTYSEMSGSIVAVTDSLEFARSGRVSALIFTRFESLTYLRCGDVQVGISRDGSLAEIIASS